MKFCYFDESGHGDIRKQPILVSVSVIADARRMHITKSQWFDLLAILSEILKTNLKELHTKDFYPGNSAWRNMKGNRRSQLIEVIIRWMNKRKHKLNYSVIDRREYEKSKNKISNEFDVKTDWCVASIHQLLTLQKYGKTYKNNKGNFLAIFDNQYTEQTKLLEFLEETPDWIDSYCNKSKKEDRLSQLVDVPYFGDSKHVKLIQIADFFSYLFRLYFELNENIKEENYKGEIKKVNGYIKEAKTLLIPRRHRYNIKKKDKFSNLLNELTPPSAIELGE